MISRRNFIQSLIAAATIAGSMSPVEVANAAAGLDRSFPPLIGWHHYQLLIHDGVMNLFIDGMPADVKHNLIEPTKLVDMSFSYFAKLTYDDMFVSDLSIPEQAR